jgi:hypothetical protein
MNSPNFSDFRQLLDRWDEVKDKFNKKCLMEDNDLVFFFQKDKKIYGSGENGRLVFARMKNPDDEDKAWISGASFSAHDLEDSSSNNERLFTSKDLKNIKIINQEEAVKKLEKKGKKFPSISDSNTEIDEK